LPVVDELAAEYGDRVDFVAPAWKSSFESTKAFADTVFASGKVMWGLDEAEAIFRLYGIPYQPVTVLIASDRTIVAKWAGVSSKDDLRASIENLIALSG
jgi:hypothetical protein